MPRGWDGCIDYISESLKFRSGLLQVVHDKIIELGGEVVIIDNTLDFKVKPRIPTRVGNQKPRPYQIDSVKSLIYNKIANHYHYQGVMDAATNAGKTTIMAMIFHAFRRKIPAIILLKDGDLFEQFRRELPELINSKHLGFVRGKEINFQHVTVAMVQTLSPQASHHKNALAKFGIVLVDEADEGDSKSYKTIIKYLYNAKVRVGLSGTIYMSKLKKDEAKNMNLRSFFGNVLFKITKKEMVDLGYSTPVIVKLWPGSNLPSIPGDFAAEYDTNITHNKQRAKEGLKLLRKAILANRLPGIVIFRYHKHGELLYKKYKKLALKYNLTIDFVHGDTKNRKDILKNFREGKIDILISSFIVKRGKNFPLIKYIQNASATDSNETVSQIMGRGERKHDTKKLYHLDDFMDEGRYLGRHSRHRLRYYKAEGFKVIDKTK